MWSIVCKLNDPSLAGFDMSAVATDVYDDAIVDIVNPDGVISTVYVVKVRAPLPPYAPA